MMGAALALLVSTACQSAPAPAAEVQPDPGAQPAPPPATGSMLPAGSDLQLRLKEDLNPATLHVGDTFTASVVKAIVASNGEVAIPNGSVATGMISGVSTAEGRTLLRMNFLRISVKGVWHPFTVDIRELQAGNIVTGDVRTEIAKQLGAGAGTIVTLSAGASLAEGTEMTVRNRDDIELRQR
jgi:hypothetical protein